MNIESMVPNLRDPAIEEFDTRTLLKNAAEQAQKRHYEDFLIVDTDAHHYETESFSQIVEYMESPAIRQLARGFGSGAPGASLMSGVPGFQDMGGRVSACSPPRCCSSGFTRRWRSRW